MIRRDGSKMYLAPALWQTLLHLLEFFPNGLIPATTVYHWYNRAITDPQHSFRNDLYKIRKALKGSGWQIITHYRLGWIWRPESEVGAE